MNKENKIQRVKASNNSPNERKPDWWESLPPGERKLICSLMRMLRVAKQSQLKDVAKAAAEWERGIGCFIKVRLMNGHNATVKHFRRKQVRITVQPGNPQNN